jgi:hypothetical protein
MRRLPPDIVLPQPCCRCTDDSRSWDQIAGKSYCPNCLEDLAVGEADYLIEWPQPILCDACSELDREKRIKTVTFLTWPLQSVCPMEMALCGNHLRDLCGRRLRPFPFESLVGRLAFLELKPADVFLLHAAFYDLNGIALQPAIPIAATKYRGREG